jgi:hypothetical protein
MNLFSTVPPVAPALAEAKGVALADGALSGIIIKAMLIDGPQDMARMAADPETQRWWAINMPLQRPLDTRKDGEWWAEMTEIFHLD